MNQNNKFTPLSFNKLEDKIILENTHSFYQKINKRRSVRHFSNTKISKTVIENIIKTASSAPSGAHKQPWTFCAISNKKIKQKIRVAAEKEEKLGYEKRMSKEWLKDLEKFETNWQKPMLEDAPWLIVVFMKTYNIENKEKTQNYYIKESVGIACGFLLTAIHQAGLCSLTHTPTPMRFLAEILKRPKNEKAFLLIPVGFPTKDCKVPILKRKTLEEMAVFYE